MTRGGRASWILAIVAHVLAWVAYLPLAVGLVIWPYLQGDRGEEFGILIAVFVPVALTRSGLAYSASRPQEPGYFPIGRQGKGCSHFVGANGGIGHLCVQPVLSAGMGEIGHWRRHWGSSPCAGVHRRKDRAVGGSVGCRFITVGFLCTDGFFGWRLFPAIRPAIAVAGDGLQL